ncbi:multidrug ABC transporter ATPase [Paraburkholderia sp. J63]|uniref:hypothetical protein n=1 Tax=Paraburkholderia sp. J63 TaxID=2805434 RepID=UPI002ABE6C9C|nr:multidrug ABC transporter ATPase [Paraburkholderia sp. J63]
MRRFIWAAVPLAFAVSTPAFADDDQPCDDGIVAAVSQWAGIKGNLAPWGDKDGLVAAAACKIMPNAPDTTIAALAFDTGHVGPNSDDGKLAQVVALVEGGKVMAANRSVIEQDATTQVGSFRIDTAPYQLSPDVRAFGVVFDSSARGPSCPDAVAEHELTLFVRDAHALRPVFGTNLRGWVDINQGACGSGTDGALTEDANMTIAVAKTSSHGFADLALTAHIVRSRLENRDWADIGKRTKRVVLKYDGKSYGIDMFRDFWYPNEGTWAKHGK